MDLLRRRDAGVTLVETLIALMILAVVAISILTMFSRSMQLNATGMDYTTLTNIGKDKLEELVGLPFGDDQLAANPAQPHSETRGDALMVVTWDIADYSINQNRPTLAAAITGGEVAAIDANTKLITVTVVSQPKAALGRRDVTIQGVKSR